MCKNDTTLAYQPSQLIRHVHDQHHVESLRESHRVLQVQLLWLVRMLLMLVSWAEAMMPWLLSLSGVLLERG